MLDYKKEKEFLVCIDSDGTIMDTMTIKHVNCFGPEFINVFKITSHIEDILNEWNRANLYSLTRGIDLKSSAYMLNTMSLRFFEMDIYCTGRRVLLKKFKRPADKIVSSMKDVNSFNGEYLISHIKQKIKE